MASQAFASIDVLWLTISRLGFVLSGMNLGALIAPFLAGIVYERAGYYAVYGMILGLIGADILLRGVMIEKRTARKWLIEASSTSSATITNVNDQGSMSEGDSDTENGVENLGTPGLSSEDEQQHLRKPLPEETSPLLPKPFFGKRNSGPWFKRHFPRMAVLLSSPRLRAGFYGCFTHTTLTACFDTILSIFVKRTFGWRSTGAGLIFLCITVPTLLGTSIGSLSDRFGPRKMALIGFAVTVPSLAVMAFVQHNNIESKVGICVILTIVGELLHYLLPLAQAAG